MNQAVDAAPILSVREISKSYGGLHAVRQASIDIFAGEVVALVGDNGAGKSSFIKMLSGVMQPDAGSILVGGREMQFHSPADARSAGIETLHQSLGLVDVFDVRENLFLGRELTTTKWGVLPVIDTRAMRQRTEELLARIDLKLPSIDAKVRSMSGGQRQSVAIARLLLEEDVRLLIMDEPMAALGVNEGQKVLQLIDSLRTKGLSTLIISHNLEHVFTVADRIAVMKSGRLIDVVNTREVQHDDIVSMIMTGRPLLAKTAAPA